MSRGLREAGISGRLAGEAASLAGGREGWLDSA